MKKGTFNPSVTGLFTVLILVSLVSLAATKLVGELAINYGVPDAMNGTQEFTTVKELEAQADDMRNAINFNKSSSWLDVIGGYFSAGIEAGKMSLTSINLLTQDMDAASDAVQGIDSIKKLIVLLVIFSLVIGVIVAAMIKWRI